MQIKIIDLINNRFSMKKLLSFVLIATIFLGFFTGCKKGDMDPFFSIYSRKHRVVGEWEINSWKDSRTYIDNGGTNTIVNINISGTNITIDTTYLHTTNNHDTTKTWTGVVNEAKYNFKKTGDLEYVLDFTLTHEWKNTDDNTGHTYDSTYTWNYRFINSGTWNFLAKIDDYKNKERISMVWENTKVVVNFSSHLEDDDGNGSISITNNQTLESTEDNYANGEFNDIWALEELKEKEIIMNKTYNQIHTHALTGTLGEKETVSGTSETTLQPKAKKQ